MNEKRYVVPPEMLKAACRFAVDNNSGGLAEIKGILEAAIRWLAENPVVPTDEQLQVFRKQWDDSENWSRKQGERGDFFRWSLIEWHRRMFLAPEPEVPEAIKDLWEQAPKGGTAQEAILEAYRRGKEAK